MALAAYTEAMIPLFPVHAALVAKLDATHAVVRLDAVAGTLPAGVRSVLLGDGSGLRAGDEFDAIASGRGTSLRLRDPRVAERFAAGTPNALVTHLFAVGDRLPNVTLVDQRGAPFSLGNLGGKTTLLSFVFTRCPDRTMCPEISAKFRAIERQLDPARFHLVEVTLDPSFDSPAVLARYGDVFDARPDRWSLLTGRASDVKDLMDGFGISSIADGSANFVHDDELAIVGPDGRLASLIPTAGSNPLRRFELATVAGVIAMCGGSTQTANVVLDSVVFVLGVAILGSVLFWWGRRIFAEN
jgi:cytochrome oxidase Cu insertion factor (SCO1/SenC/PrrC family)